MKLRNKLVPLASCFATVATLAPVSLTSCASVSNFVNLKDGFKDFTVEKAKPIGTGFLNADDALTLYTNAVIENPKVFYEDAYWSTATALRAVVDNPTYSTDYGISHSKKYVTQIDSLEEQLSDVKFGRTKFTFTYPQTAPEEKRGKTVNLDLPTISFKLERNQQMTYKYVPSEYSTITYDVTGVTNYTMNISNVPFFFGFMLNTEDLLSYGSAAALGREYYLNPYVMNYIPSDWTIRLDVTNYLVDGVSVYYSALEQMTDDWEISYTMHTQDTSKVTIAGVETVSTSEANDSAKFTSNWVDFKASEAYKYISAWRMKSHYLSDIGYEAE